ncbi:hypothetical protein HELRODRAFT_167979 [Helobdella robusta]|uniref:Uncharacterized protein n=1 Tax=Helobdella robusta TaxID=6412 RepID=T1F011_HELRO|nr:hypothetical protein HELRODRAFT_167979 [Helobdella robusta]ESO10121.1 hypothetical protein HELRODRAFT_167979 [Helobdella robusta]
MASEWQLLTRQNNIYFRETINICADLVSMYLIEGYVVFARRCVYGLAFEVHSNRTWNDGHWHNRNHDGHCFHCPHTVYCYHNHTNTQCKTMQYNTTHATRRKEIKRIAFQFNTAIYGVANSDVSSENTGVGDTEIFEVITLVSVVTIVQSLQQCNLSHEISNAYVI